jgi:integrase
MQQSSAERSVRKTRAPLRGVRQRPNGTWEARYTVTEAATGSRTISLYAKTQRAAETKLHVALAAKHQGARAPRGRDTVAGYLTAWLAGARLTMERQQTWDRYEALLRLYFITTALGTRRLRDVDQDALREHYRRLVDAGKTRSTVHHAHRVFRSALADAVREGKIPSNPASGLEWSRPRPPEMQTLTAVEVQALLDHAREWDRGLFMLAAYTGMRLGELLALRWADVDQSSAHPSLRVVRTLLDVRGGIPLTGEPKTDHSRRRVALSHPLVDELREQRRRLVEQRVRLASLWQDYDLVFPTWRGTPRRRANVTRDLHATLERGRLPRIRFHDLRHTAASLLLGAGVHPKIVSEMLGHSSIAVTMDLYSHVNPSMQGRAADAMAAVMETASVQRAGVERLGGA